MESLFEVLTNLSSVIGVPAALCLAWAAFVIRDHAKRIEKLETALEEFDDKRAEELNKIYDRINKMADDVGFIKGMMANSPYNTGNAVVPGAPRLHRGPH